MIEVFTSSIDLFSRKVKRLRICAFFGFAFAVSGSGGILCGAEKPNIVFIYADDLGWGDLACHGHREIKTPHLDQLASEGVDFHQFTVSNPVCSPSRFAIVTGKFPARFSVHQHFSSPRENAQRGMPDWLDPGVTLLPRLLKESGYATAHYGKWHLSGGRTGNAPPTSAYGYDDAAVYVGPGRHVFAGTKYGSLVRESSARDETAASYLSVAATDHAVAFVEKSVAAGRPFYINLWLHETHHLVSATKEEKALYPETAEPERTYFGAVSRADRQVGRIMKTLRDHQVDRDTIVIFSSDNGPENTHPNPGDKFYFSVGSTGGLRGRKRSLFLGGVNTPFIVRWPGGGVPAGRVDKSSVISGVDVFPTLLAAAGVAAPENWEGDGENILSAFRGEKFSRKRPLFWQWRGNHGQKANWPALGMREGDWQLVIDESGQRAELFDLSQDRAQAKDVSDEHPGVVDGMRKKIDEWVKSLPPDSVRPKTPKPAKGRTKSSQKTPPGRAAAFEKKDLDGNGELTLNEYLHNFPGPDAVRVRFPKFDRDGNGVLSRDEFVNPN